MLKKLKNAYINRNEKNPWPTQHVKTRMSAFLIGFITYRAEEINKASRSSTCYINDKEQVYNAGGHNQSIFLYFGGIEM